MIDKVEKLIEDDLERLGFRLWGLETSGNGRSKTLRVFIDSTESINVEDCSLVSRHLSAMLDASELFESVYSLEISSPGIDRTLFRKDQFSLYLGSNLRIRYRDEDNKYKTQEGILEKVNEESIILVVKEDILEISFSEIEKANLKEIF
tara:strand:- start:11726 stop:12172 length:447 start_codon:yes stop_codon:yes gene_type:complete